MENNDFNDKIRKDLDLLDKKKKEVAKFMQVSDYLTNVTRIQRGTGSRQYGLIKRDVGKEDKEVIVTNEGQEIIRGALAFLDKNYPDIQIPNNYDNNVRSLYLDVKGKVTHTKEFLGGLQAALGVAKAKCKETCDLLGQDIKDYKDINNNVPKKRKKNKDASCCSIF